MADFGKLPKGTRFGLVPAWPLQLPDLNPSPKALYACLCTSADEKGQLWRSIDRLSREFSVNRRQIQRWLNALEAAGLIVRMGRRGRAPYLLVIRNPEGCNWARTANLKNIVARRRSAVPYGREGARRKKELATLVPPENDAQAANNATPASPKHNLENKLTSTKEAAQQEIADCTNGASSSRKYGLKRCANNSEFIQEKLNELVSESGGWAAFLCLPSSEMVQLLAQRCGAGASRREIEAALSMPEFPR